MAPAWPVSAGLGRPHRGRHAGVVSLCTATPAPRPQPWTEHPPSGPGPGPSTAPVKTEKEQGLFSDRTPVTPAPQKASLRPSRSAPRAPSQEAALSTPLCGPNTNTKRRKQERRGQAGEEAGAAVWMPSSRVRDRVFSFPDCLPVRVASCSGLLPVPLLVARWQPVPGTFECFRPRQCFMLF